jgi:hypothetical protein
VRATYNPKIETGEVDWKRSGTVLSAAAADGFFTGGRDGARGDAADIPVLDLRSTGCSAI